MIVQMLDIVIIGLIVYFAYKRYRSNNMDSVFFILILLAFLILVLMLAKLFFFN